MQIGVRAWSSLPEQNREEVTSIRLLRSFPSRAPPLVEAHRCGLWADARGALPEGLDSNRLNTDWALIPRALLPHLGGSLAWTTARSLRRSHHVSRQTEACSEAAADEGRCGMTDPAEMIAWLDRPPFKKPRPEMEIETKENDIARSEEIRGAHLKALDPRDQAGSAP